MAQPASNMPAMTEHTGAHSPTRFFAPMAIILGIPLLFAAIYFYTSPVVLMTGGEQGIFKCGSPSSPNTDAKNVCAVPEEDAQKKAMYAGASGIVLVGLGAAWLLLPGRRDEDEWDERDRRRRDDDWDERDRRRRDDVDEDHDDVAEDDSPRQEHLDPSESRSARHRGRPVRSDERPSRRRPPRDRRSDDDWASDGWR